MTVEREISSIETANINKETFVAMQNAGKAMKQIHGDLNIDKVDQTMYGLASFPSRSIFIYCKTGINQSLTKLYDREDLREQHAIGEEISEALTSGSTAQGVDEDELDEQLAELQQEQLDEKMLKTGTVPVSDQVHRLPTVGNNESTLPLFLTFHPFPTSFGGLA